MPTDAERIKELEAELAAYKINGAIGLYYELNRVVNSTVELSRSSSLKTMIESDEKGDKKFERLQALIKNAKDHIISMEEIKMKLGLTGEEEKDRVKKPFIDRIADPRT